MLGNRPDVLHFLQLFKRTPNYCTSKNEFWHPLFYIKVLLLQFKVRSSQIVFDWSKNVLCFFSHNHNELQNHTHPSVIVNDDVIISIFERERERPPQPQLLVFFNVCPPTRNHHHQYLHVSDVSHVWNRHQFKMQNMSHLTTEKKST